MKRRILGCLLLLVMIPAVAFASAVKVSSTDLIENALALDGQTVVYTGEAIGDLMPRGDHAWVNLSDGSNAIGVWIDADMLRTVSTMGRYGQVGDILQVTGVFHRACQEHGGDMDLHAEQIVVLQKGHTVQGAVSGWKIILAIMFMVLDIVILIVYLKRTNKRGIR
jgi:hypothetical protein